MADPEVDPISDPPPSTTPGILGPCEPYCTLDDFCEGTEIRPEDAADCIIDASEILYALLGRTLHGICSATVETDAVCAAWTDGRTSLGGWWAWHRDLGLRPWVDRGSIILQTPVVTITSVTVDGVALGFDEFQLRDKERLVRSDRAAWNGVVQIAYSFGAPIPRYARDACIELATELWKEKCGRASCLPVNTSSVSRQGVSINLDQNVQRVREAGPALPKVMVAMSVINPTGQRMDAEVWSPDNPLPLHTVRTFEAPP